MVARNNITPGIDLPREFYRTKIAQPKKTKQCGLFVRRYHEDLLYFQVNPRSGINLPAKSRISYSITNTLILSQLTMEK